MDYYVFRLTCSATAGSKDPFCSARFPEGKQVIGTQALVSPLAALLLQIFSENNLLKAETGFSFSLPAENCLPECFARPQVTLEKFEFNFSLGVLCKRGPFSVLTSSQLMLNCSLFSNSYSSAISQDLGSQSNGGDYASCTGFCNKSEQIFNQQKETSASAVYYILKETSKYLRIT